MSSRRCYDCLFPSLTRCSMTTLCSDKTGTLTLNELHLTEPFLNGIDKEEVRVEQGV